MKARTASQRLFALAGWIVAVPIVLAALYVAFVVTAVFGRMIAGGVAGAVLGIVVVLALLALTIKRVAKG